MNSVSRERVVVFSKSAEWGTVKTRMTPVLDDEKCLTLHLSLLQDTLFKARQFSSVLYLSGSGSLPFNPELPVRRQAGGDLGERMRIAFQQELQVHSKVAIIGTDSPTLPVEQIRKAFDALDRYEVVLGPSEDGGYYLLALRRMVPEIFSDVPWGTAKVLSKTLEKITERSYLLLDTYFDVDLPEDLVRLKKELEVVNGPHLIHIRKWIDDYFALSAT